MTQIKGFGAGSKSSISPRMGQAQNPVYEIPDSSTTNAAFTVSLPKITCYRSVLFWLCKEPEVQSLALHQWTEENFTIYVCYAWKNKLNWGGGLTACQLLNSNRFVCMPLSCCKWNLN